MLQNISHFNYSTVFLITLIFGGLAFLYSFFGFLSSQTTPRFDTFGSLTLQEIGGHFLFGYIVALPTRNLKIGVLAGLMALAIDADHVLNAAGTAIQGRMSHSVSFAILSAVLMGFIVTLVYRRIARENSIIMASSVSSAKIEKKLADNANSRQNSVLIVEKSSVFYGFLVITLAAYMSHIAYDVFVDLGANFPLLAPFSFKDVFIPQIFALPLEGAAILLVYFWYRINSKNNQR
ncbi:MAG TPA: metal-dependent hydrolase [Candidatus Nitrosopolaris sp.]|nr:metal-dependent hydrolase [Candidatus Nitrosopolaris sp.]